MPERHSLRSRRHPNVELGDLASFSARAAFTSIATTTVGTARRCRACFNARAAFTSIATLGQASRGRFPSVSMPERHSLLFRLSPGMRGEGAAQKFQCPSGIHCSSDHAMCSLTRWSISKFQCPSGIHCSSDGDKLHQRRQQRTPFQCPSGIHFDRDPRRRGWKGRGRWCLNARAAFTSIATTVQAKYVKVPVGSQCPSGIRSNRDKEAK